MKSYRNLVLFSLFALLLASCGSELDQPQQNGPQQLQQELSTNSNQCLVKCAWRQCPDGQHLVVRPGACCGVCVGKPELSASCATVLCLAVMCPEGETRVYTNPKDCCGTCLPASL